MSQIINIESIENKLIELRNQKVMMDSDVAEIYGVETKRINEAVKNNQDKFPEGYLFELNSEEWLILKSKFSTSIKGGKIKRPKAFTEKGLYMLATILKSKIAICHSHVNGNNNIYHRDLCKSKKPNING